jgi:hypothetical protein
MMKYQERTNYLSELKISNRIFKRISHDDLIEKSQIINSVAIVDNLFEGTKEKHFNLN